MSTDPTAPLPPSSDEEPTLIHGRATVPPYQQAGRPEYPATAIPYQRPPRSAAVPILVTLVVILVLALLGLTAHTVSAGDDARRKQNQLTAQIADQQRQIQELQAQVAAATAEAQKARTGDAGKAEQLGSCADALTDVLKARSGDDFGKAWREMQERCKVAGIPLF
ncbi:hypothetical protein [Hamadaea tsunoensis]|uniref:hypothetical protein n=1 Tax=Hamadaea tsunoensis TaxID=53368 RepID=UPI0003FDCD30|nr:hypothetical protein [Hamadaea tsunoensis]